MPTVVSGYIKSHKTNNIKNNEEPSIIIITGGRIINRDHLA